MKEFFAWYDAHYSYCLSKMHDYTIDHDHRTKAIMAFNEVEKHLSDVKKSLKTFPGTSENIFYEFDSMRYCAKRLSDFFNNQAPMNADEVVIYLSYYDKEIGKIVEMLRE